LLSFVDLFNSGVKINIMIGFFEHQLLSYKKNHIKNLLALAKADGFMHDKSGQIQKIARNMASKNGRWMSSLKVKKNLL